MLIEELRKLPAYNFLKKVDVAREFRKLSLDLKVAEKLDNLMIKSDISEDQINSWKLEFGSIFMEDDSSYLLWVCRCTYIKKNTLLSLLNEQIKLLSSVKRYTLNTYKRVGWDIHVLYVYQLVNYNFLYNIIPKSVEWKFDIKKIISFFHVLRSGLSCNADFLIKIGCFIHDVGVTIAVKGHESLGVDLVDKIYEQLQVSHNYLSQNNITLRYEDIIVFLKVIVGNHQLINQVTAEASDEYIEEKMKFIKKQLSYCKATKKIYYDEFVEMMMLLAVADLMGVDDLLLTEFKMTEIFESYNYLKMIVEEKDVRRDPQIYGAKRTIALLPERYKQKGDEELKRILDMFGCRQNEFFSFIYNVKYMSYVMAAVKALDNIELSIKLLISCMFICEKEQLGEKIVIEIDPNISIEKLSAILSKFSLTDIINGNSKMSYIADIENDMLSIAVEVDD